MVDLLQIVRNLVGYLPSLYGFVSVLCFAFAVGFGIVGLRALARRSEMGPNGGSWWSPAATIAIASIFAAIPAFWQSLTVTFFGAGMGVPSAEAIFSYAPATLGLFEAGSPGRELISGIVAIVQFIGLIAVVRGLFLLNRAAQGGNGQPVFGPGITFVIAGVMAINFPLFVGTIELLITSG
jgi:hypothetical protein